VNSRRPRSRSSRGQIAKLAVAASVVALVAAATVAAAAKPAASPATCKTSVLVVWLNTSEGAAAGSTSYTLEFTNESEHACSLAGYPRVSAVDLHSHILGRQGSPDRSTHPVAIALAGGATGTAGIRIVDARNFPLAACHPNEAAGLIVAPPTQTAAKLVPFPFEACSSSGPVVLYLKPVTGQ